jgi:hypothetical protein
LITMFFTTRWVSAGLLAASCSAPDSSTTSRDVPSTVTASAAPPAASTPPTAASTNSGSTQERSEPAIVTVPAQDATDVSVLEPVTVTAADGVLDLVTVTNPEGLPVAGGLSADQKTWTSSEPLGYGRTYDIHASARDAAGRRRWCRPRSRPWNRPG